MSRIGRKSVFSQENSQLNYTIKEKEKSNETLHCVVLDIVGAHKPTTKFFPNRIFDKGIYIIVGVYETFTVEAVYWNKCYDYLRTMYGVDDNIIGRECVVETATRSSFDISQGELEFREGKRNSYQEETNETYLSISGLSGMLPQYDIQIKYYYENDTEGVGEIWSKFEP